METNDLLNSIVALLKLEIENNIYINNNEIVIDLGNDNLNKIKLIKLL